MNVFEKCDELKKEIKSQTARSENVRLWVNPIIYGRLKNTANLLHISRNELINIVLDRVLI